MRSNVFFFVAVLALLSLTVTNATQSPSTLCSPPASIRLHIATQGTGRALGPFTSWNQYTQYAFVNNIIGGVVALNTEFTSTTPGSPPNNGVFPGYDSTVGTAKSKPSTYQTNNHMSVSEYAANNVINQKLSPTGTYPQWQNIFGGLNLNVGTPSIYAAVVDAAMQLSTSPTSLPTLIPHPNEVKIAIFINDGEAWQNTNPTQGPAWSAGQDLATGAAIPVDSPAYKAQVARIDAEYQRTRCKINDLLDAGINVIWIHSNRSSLVGQAPVASFGTSNQLRGNLAAGSAIAPNQNADNVRLYDFPFGDYSDLMSESILQPISSLIRDIASPGRGAASSCVLSGEAHITSFDGLHFDYASGVGDFWAFRSLIPSNPLAVQARFAPCPNDASAGCIVGAVIADGIDRVEVTIADRTGNLADAKIVYNGALLGMNSFASVNYGRTHGPVSFVYPDANINITVLRFGTEGGFQVRVQYVSGHSILIQKGFLKITPSPAMYGRAAGMCGNWNSCPADDLISSCGTITTVDQTKPSLAQKFGDSWAVNAGESLFSTPPAQGVFAWEVTGAPICRWDTAKLLSTPAYNRWPFLPAYQAERTSAYSSVPAQSTFGVPVLKDQAEISNNPGLLTLTGLPSYVASVPQQCARLRGALQQDCINDVARGSGDIDGIWEVVYQACSQYCATGYLFTKLVTKADCIAAQLCTFAENTPDLHKNYGSATYTADTNTSQIALPDVTFGNTNSRASFFQPTLGLAGRYFLEVSETDLCGTVKKVEAYDIQCGIDTPQVVLTLPALTNAPGTSDAVPSGEGSDPLLTKVVNVLPDLTTGYPLITIQASVFPSSNVQGQSWRFITYPNMNVSSQIVVNATLSNPLITIAPEIQGKSSNRARFQPNVPGVYVVEFAVWTGCSVSRNRVQINAACSVAPPAASIQPVTNANTAPTNIPFSSSSNIAVSWLGQLDQNILYSPTQANIQAAKSRWSSVRLNTGATFDSDTPKKMLQYRWTLASAVRKTTGTASLDNIQLISTQTSLSNLGGMSQVQPQGLVLTQPWCQSGISLEDGLDYTNLLSQVGASYINALTGTRTTVYTFGLVDTRTNTTNIYPATQISQIQSVNTTFNTALQPVQQFSASSGMPATGVSPFNKLYNAFRSTTTNTLTTQIYTEQNVTVPQPTPLCQVTLTEQVDPTGSTVLVEFAELGDVPHENLPVNYCKDAVYSIQLQVNDECQSSNDTITLEPTCDGYTQAIVECDQYIYWDNSIYGFPAAVIDGTQSYDEMYNSPISYSQTTGSTAAAVPAARKLQYLWSVDSVVTETRVIGAPLPATRALTATGFTYAGLNAPKQGVIADVPGKYNYALTVGNRCVVSPKTIGSVIFSCWNAPPCTATLTPKIVVSVGTGIVNQPYTSGVSQDLPSQWTGTAYQTVFLDLSTSTDNNPGDHVVYMRIRYVVVTSPAGSAYQTPNSLVYETITQWIGKDTGRLAFTPDVAGAYTINAQLTDSCGCLIVERAVKIVASCGTPSDKAVPILFDTFNPQTPTAAPTTQPASFPDQYFGAKVVIGTPSPAPRPVSWTVSGGGLSTPQTTTLEQFVFTPPAIGTYSVGLTSSDGCQAVSNSTTFRVIAAPVVPTPPACTVATANAQLITSSGLAGSNSAPFKTWSLPKATMVASNVATNGFDTFDYSTTSIQWLITQAPIDSIYFVGSSATTNTNLLNADNTIIPNTTFDPTTNTRLTIYQHKTTTTSVVTTVTTTVVIPLLTQAASANPVTGIWGTSTYGSEGFGPLKYENAANGIKPYTQLHSQVCVTLDRPGVYKFKLRFMNTTDPAQCISESEVSFTASCNSAPTGISVTTLPATPTIDSLRPLRVSLSATATDAEDQAQLTYSWSFISAPQLDQPYNTMLSDRMTAKNLTQLSDISLTSPFSTNGQNFPPIFNPHLAKAHFLALAPGNHTLQVKVSDGCTTVTQIVFINVGCAGRNQYGSLTDPLTNSGASISSSAATNAFTINDANANNVLPIGPANTDGDVTRPLSTTWRVVGFVPSFSSATTLQSSGSNPSYQPPQPVQAPVANSGSQSLLANEDSGSSGLSHNQKLGLGLGLGLGGGVLLLAIGAFVFLKMRGGSPSRNVRTAAVHQTPGAPTEAAPAAMEMQPQSPSLA